MLTCLVRLLDICMPHNTRRVSPTPPTGQQFHPFSNIEQSVRDDIGAVKGHPAVPRDIPVFGFVYDVHTGKLTRVEE